MSHEHAHDGDDAPHTHDEPELQTGEMTPEDYDRLLQRANRIVNRLRSELTESNEARISAQIDIEERDEMIQALVAANAELTGELEKIRGGLQAAASAAAAAGDEE